MGLPELKSIRRFGLGRRSLKEQPERRSWRAAESAATTGRVPTEVRDPAALRAYTTPNICVQGGRIEFIQPPVERRERPEERPAAATVPSYGGRREKSPQRDAGRRDDPPVRDEWREPAPERELPHRDFGSLRDGDLRSVSCLKDRDIRTVSSPRGRGAHSLASLKERDLHHTVPKERPRYDVSSLREKDGGEMTPLIEDDQEDPEPETTLKGKERKEENNQEVRNTRPPALPDRGSPIRSPTPGRKVKDKVAQFEQLVVPRESPRRDSDSSEATSAQGTLEAEIQSLEMGLEEQCLNFKRWNRLAQRTAGESRARHSRQPYNMSVENDRCRDRIFSVQDELRRSEERLRAAELARTETEGKLAAMEAIVKAHERERQCWLGQVHQLTGQLERLQAAAASTAETGSPSRADLEVRVRSLEAERDELERRADRCLDDVANQIVQALSRQKSLQNSLETVRRRVHQLEHENAVLFTLLGRPPQPVTSQPPVTSQTTLPAPAPSGGSSDDEQLTAVCAKVRRILEEHYGSSGSSGEEPPSEPLRWSQLDGLLSEGAAPAPCLLCTSHTGDTNCRLHQSSSDQRRAADAPAGCSSADGRQAADSDVIRRLCEAADSANAAQRLLRELGSEQCSVPGATSLPNRVPSPLHLSTALTDSQKCATLGVLPLGLPPLPSEFSPSPAGTSLSALTSERLPPSSGARASSCPPHGASPASREDSRREEGRDEGYSTMSSDVQANVSADSGVSPGPACIETSSDSRPRLEDVREVQEEDGRPLASAAVTSALSESERPDRPASVSSSDSEDMRCLVEALRQSLRPGRRLHLLAETAGESDVLYLPLTGPAARHSCLVPARPRPVHRCRSDSRLCVKRWAAEAAASRPWSGRAPERSSSTLELGAVSTLDTRRAASLKRAAGQASLERGGSPPTTSAFVPAALPWRDDSSELWRNCFSLEAREMEDWSLHLSAEELRSELTDEAAGSERLADSSDYSRVGSFPNIQEAILELEEDASECLWNNASYMHQRPSGLPAWPYEHPSDDPPPLPSPGADLRISWSSCEHISLADLRDAVLDFNDKNDLKSAECESRLEAQAQEDLKRHSNGSDAMSCASVASEDERPENLETEFTRDFYRLVKYESSKSLALSEASAKGDDEPLVSSADRELALASMLNFITEQQRYIAERETEDAAQAREPITDSDSASYTAMDQSTSSATSAATTVTAPPATTERAYDERDALDSSIQLARLAQRCGERSPLTPERAPRSACSSSSPPSSAPSTSVPSAPSTPVCETVPTVTPKPVVSPVAAAAPEVIVYRAEISTNHKEYTPPAARVAQKKKGKIESRCRAGAGARESSRTGTSTASAPVAASASTPSSASASMTTSSSTSTSVSPSTSLSAPGASPKTTKEVKSGIPRSPLIGKRKRSAPNNIPRVRPPTSPKLTPRLKKDAVRPVPEPVEPPPAPAQPAAVASKPSFPSPKLLRRLHPGSSKIAGRSSSESAISRGARRAEPAPAPRSDSPQRRATAPPAPARAAARPGSRIPRLRGSRSTDSREAAGVSARETRELQRTVSEPAEMPAARQSPLIVSEGAVTSFHRRATSRQLIDELKRMSALEPQEAPPLEPRLRREGCDTGWVRVDRRLDLGNAQVRSELYDVMQATRGSSDSSSSDSESDVTPRSAGDYQHLKLLHQQRRRKQVSRRKDGALRYTPVFRPPIMNRPEFFFRYGPQEQAALATFDFLDRLPSVSSADVTAGRR
ncbi:pneumococcal serine-rich repeat protein-like isoform X1 [Amphibalanus amphitrite]|uniref:pneumococcal serine-rich repeat protein-like isoform X1 n=2 Tax=Amphibalanus amphitrite TaxID=1232801 RepID=UPI001C90A3E9|nr:pneumococcal serine-rich repeat protein-like isoform X1 [Amphibalanus amphitrite]